MIVVLERKAGSGIMLTLLLVSVFMLASGIQPVRASGTIYIRADGSIDPPTTLIQRVGEVYTFTGNISDSIVIERDNIVLDGAGYTVEGTWSSNGISSGVSNITIKNTNIKGFYHGIHLENSSNNTIYGNNVTGGHYYGMYLWGSSNTIYGNSITYNWFGIYLRDSSYGVLRNNTMVGNRFGFGVWGYEFSHFVNDVDQSNTVNGKPIYYWVGRQNAEVPSDAGCLVLTNCTKITAKNLNLNNNKFSILLVYTRDSTIAKSNITNNHHALTLYSSSSNTIHGNNITNNEDGISLLENSSSNTIDGNSVTNNWWGGMYLDGSSSNTIHGNNITNNPNGIYLSYSSSNIIYHNNFVDDSQPVHSEDSVNVWDNGYPSGGNFWSDYVGVDVKNSSGQDLPGSDGIGDTPYVINANNRDRYPLMNPYGAPPPPTYALTITTTVGGTTTPAPGIYSYTANSQVQVTAIPNTDYLFEYWELDGTNVGPANPYTVAMNKNHTVKAIFSHLKPSVPVGGYSFPIGVQTTTNPSNIYVATITILTAVFTIFKRKASNKTTKKKQTKT